MGKKILLADDSITIQKVIELTFSDEDFEVVTVGNGRLAIERLPEARPDLVLCDIIMPEKDGYEVCDFIKKHPTLSNTPVLLLTGAFEPFDQERAARVGCDGFLAKPFEPQTLIAKVKELLAQAGSKSASSSAPAPAPVPSASSVTQAAPAWSNPASSAPAPATVSIFAPAAPAPAAAPVPAQPKPEPVPADDDFGSGEAFGADASGSSSFGGGADIGTLKSPAFRAEEKDRFAAPPSLDELYDDDPYGGANDLMPLSDDEADSVSPPPPAKPDAAEPAPWAQPTVEVPLEMRAQAGVESAQMASEGFEEVFEDEAPAPAARESAPAPAPPAPPFAAPTPTAAPPAVERGFGFGRQEDVPASPATASSPAPPPTVKESFAWGRDADVSAAAAVPAKESPDSSFRDVAPAEEEEQTSISRSVAGEVNVPVDMVEKIAQRVVAQISEKVIREIAWEVIPDLAEALIKREIDRLKAELQQT